MNTPRYKHRVEHLGKVLNTNTWAYLSKDQCDDIRKQYYAKPDFDLVAKNLKDICAGGTGVSAITRYYVRDLMSKVVLHHSKWSVAEMLECDDLIRHFHGRVLSNVDVYPVDIPLIKNFETAIRVGSKGATGIPTNFPMDVVDSILKTYNINDRYYDFSCGWGVRLLSAMKHDIEYLGTDPNHELVERLNTIHRDYDTVNTNVYMTGSKVDIRCQGSEFFVPEWENSVGVAFSSPPYFTLEDYKIGNQSINNRNYDEWLKEYMLPTLNNIKRYLIDGGHLLMNIKNFSKYALYDDVFSMCESIGLVYVETRTLENKPRYSAKDDRNTDESIMVFRK